ncbi:AmmeMemoRadiSam system radical SAM enzyme [uncultured Sphaerochaeta sp.]|uniref:AmmeMemoRadiSam system radical SAM enzyme n=1 Tax=uncultured Sphaerochaeta sp. TaxID=886478 RepID=UPI002A0A6D7B|nr:AmmeMemoRadiSam system radical SAM enzyme [uncultured Sphaerochaeta sp.]
MSTAAYLVCDFCYRHCRLKDGEIGFCGVRERSGDTIFTHNYGGLVSSAIDPVEKKPLYHFLPGTNTLSIAMFGCNLTCTFCQNYAISQRAWEAGAQRTYYTAREVVQLARDNRCPSISFTYSEPLVWQDYMVEVATFAKQEGLKTIMVTNGSFSEEALNRISPYIDAFNIDIKGDEAFYRDYCGGSSRPVWKAIEHIAPSKAHLEITTMVMEGVHTKQMISSIGRRLYSAGVQVWHLSRYFPRYKEQKRETSEHFLQEMVKVAKDSQIPFIYPGNSSLDQNTYCPHCKTSLVRRSWVFRESIIDHSHCPECGRHIYGTWS